MPIVRGVCGHIKVRWDSHQNCLSCSCCSRLYPFSTCNLWSEKIWDLADKRQTYSARKSTMRKKKQTKKRQNDDSDVSEDNSFLDGSTTPQGYTAGCKTHRGGFWKHPKYVHQTLVTSHHQAPANQALVNQTLVNQLPGNQSFQTLVNQAPGRLPTINQATVYQAPARFSAVNQVPGYQALGNQSVVI